MDIVELEGCPHCEATLEIRVPDDYGRGRCSACGGNIVVTPDDNVSFQVAAQMVVACLMNMTPALREMAKSPRDLAELERLNAGLLRLQGALR